MRNRRQRRPRSVGSIAVGSVDRGIGGAGLRRELRCSSSTTWVAVTPSGKPSSALSSLDVGLELLAFLPLGPGPRNASTGRNRSSGGLAHQIDHVLLVGGSGQLHRDRVALPGHLGFGDADRVDALADDPDRLVELLVGHVVDDLAVLDRLQVDRHAALQVETQLR